MFPVQHFLVIGDEQKVLEAVFILKIKRKEIFIPYFPHWNEKQPKVLPKCFASAIYFATISLLCFKRNSLYSHSNFEFMKFKWNMKVSLRIQSQFNCNRRQSIWSQVLDLNYHMCNYWTDLHLRTYVWNMIIWWNFFSLKNSWINPNAHKFNYCFV